MAKNETPVTADVNGNVDSGSDVKVSGDTVTTKAIRATINKQVSEKLDTASEKIDKGVLVEMALELLFKSGKEERLALYELVINRRAKDIVSLDF